MTVFPITLQLWSIEDRMNEPLRSEALASDSRPNPLGGSLSSECEDSNYSHTKERLVVLESDLDKSRNELSETKRKHDGEKSSWLRREASLLQTQQRLNEELDELRRETDRLRNELQKKDSEIKQLFASRDSASLSHSTDQSSASFESQTIKFMRRLAPQLEAYKKRVAELADKLRAQKHHIISLSKHCKGTELRRGLMPSSMDSTSSQHTGLSTSNLNFTLSLASANHTDRYGQTYESRPSTGSMSRLDPVESSDHIYTNDNYNRNMTTPLPLASESSEAGVYTTRRPTKPPVPMPRSRSLKYTPSGVMQESMQPSVEPFEIVDRPPQQLTPPTNRQLNVIREQSNGSAEHRSAIQSNSSNQPTRLSQNVSPAYTDSGIGGRDDRHIGHMCGVCYERFPHLTERQFLDHCLDCADRAADQEVTDRDGPVIVNDRVTRESRVCPLCHKDCGEEISQQEFENHVNTHFSDEEAQAAGFENVTVK